MTAVSRHDYLALLEAFRASASALIRDPAGRVLMVGVSYRTVLCAPGGFVDPGESPGAAAVREAYEEVGLRLDPGRLLCLDACAPTERTPAAMLHFVFDGGVVAADTPLTLGAEEIVSADWVVPEDVERLGGEWIGRRLAVALRALADGTAYYCEEGQIR